MVKCGTYTCNIFLEVSWNQNVDVDTGYFCIFYIYARNFQVFSGTERRKISALDVHNLSTSVDETDYYQSYATCTKYQALY
jgi:hypothetical protein